MQKYIEKEFRLLEAYPEAIMNCSLNMRQQAKADDVQLRMGRGEIWVNYNLKGTKMRWRERKMNQKELQKW